MGDFRLNAAASDRVRQRGASYVSQRNTLNFLSGAAAANDAKRKNSFKVQQNTVG